MEKQSNPYIDGTYELKVGLTLLLIGLYYLLPPIPSTLAAILLFTLGLILIGLAPILVDRFLRPKVTPKKKEPLFGADMTAFLAILVFLAWIVLLTFLESIFTGRWMPILPALILAAILAVTGLRSRLWRFLLLGFVGLLVGFILAWVNLGAWTANLFLAIMGVILILSGIIELRKFLKKTPVLQERTNGR